MSAGHDRMAGLVETMKTADSLQLAAYGQEENEMRIVKDLPKAADCGGAARVRV